MDNFKRSYTAFLVKTFGPLTRYAGLDTIQSAEVDNRDDDGVVLLSIRDETDTTGPAIGERILPKPLSSSSSFGLFDELNEIFFYDRIVNGSLPVKSHEPHVPSSSLSLSNVQADFRDAEVFDRTASDDVGCDPNLDPRLVDILPQVVPSNVIDLTLREADFRIKVRTDSSHSDTSASSRREGMSTAILDVPSLKSVLKVSNADPEKHRRVGKDVQFNRVAATRAFTSRAPPNDLTLAVDGAQEVVSSPAAPRMSRWVPSS